MQNRIDLDLLERWLTGWSLARGVPLPRRADGGLVVDVGWPDQVRRHVFADAGAALRDCAARTREPFVYLKAPVDIGTLRRALPAPWLVDVPRYLMQRAVPMAGSAALPAGYVESIGAEHGALVLRMADAAGQQAAIGRVVLHGASAIFDRIETQEAHRRKGLARAVMARLDGLASAAGASERLLVATEAGRALYEALGWSVLAPYSTACLPAPPPKAP